MPFQNDTCNAERCESPTPLDMSAIVLGHTAFCPPECAREHMDQLDDAPGSVSLHDPQFHVSADDRPAGVPPDAVDIRRPVTDRSDARTAIQQAEDMFGPTPFHA